MYSHKTTAGSTKESTHIFPPRIYLAATSSLRLRVFRTPTNFHREQLALVCRGPPMCFVLLERRQMTDAKESSV